RINPSRTVLIGDASRERFALFEKILRDDFHLQALRFSNFNDLRAKVESGAPWRLVLIADDLHQTTVQKDIPLSRYFMKLEEAVTLGCIVSGDQAPDLSGVRPQPLCLYIPRTLPARVTKLREKVIAQLRGFGRLMPAPIQLPKLSFSEGDRVLREQIRGLSDHRSLDDGKEILQHLIRWFFKSEDVMIERLGQGLSGAKVFLIRMDAERGARSYVIK